MNNQVANFYEDAIMELQQKLDILRKNKENIPKEQLLGRYANSYKRLKAEISSAYIKLYDLHTEGLLCQKSKEEAQQIFDKFKPLIRSALYVEYDAHKVEQYIVEFIVEAITCN